MESTQRCGRNNLAILPQRQGDRYLGMPGEKDVDKICAALLACDVFFLNKKHY